MSEPLSLPELLDILEKRLTHGWRSQHPDRYPDFHVPYTDEELLDAAHTILESLTPEYNWQDQPKLMGGQWRTMDQWTPHRDHADNRRKLHPFTKENPTRVITRHTTPEQPA